MHTLHNAIMITVHNAIMITDQSFFMGLRTSSRKYCGGVYLAMHEHYGAVGAKHYYVPGCAIIVAIMSQQGWLSHYFGFSINNTR